MLGHDLRWSLWALAPGDPVTWSPWGTPSPTMVRPVPEPKHSLATFVNLRQPLLATNTGSSATIKSNSPNGTRTEQKHSADPTDRWAWEVCSVHTRRMEQLLTLKPISSCVSRIHRIWRYLTGPLVTTRPTNTRYNRKTIKCSWIRTKMIM